MMRLFKISAAGAMCVLTGCGRMYLLPGHTEHNLDSPPAVVMHVGEREKAIQDGFLWWPVVVPVERVMRSDDPAVVSIDCPNKSSAFLVAHTAGNVKVHYYPDSLEEVTGESNQGFEVIVRSEK
jgi:hypothetical protein